MGSVSSHIRDVWAILLKVLPNLMVLCWDKESQTPLKTRLVHSQTFNPAVCHTLKKHGLNCSSTRQTIFDILYSASFWLFHSYSWMLLHLQSLWHPFVSSSLNLSSLGLGGDCRKNNPILKDAAPPAECKQQWSWSVSRLPWGSTAL